MIAPSCKHDQTRKFGKDRKGNPRVQCCLCGKTWTEAPRSLLGEMRIDLALAEQIIKCLCEGVSVRATARLNNVCKQTVMDLMILVGERCARYMQNEFCNLAVSDVQIDEVWQYIYCKQKTAIQNDFGPEVGDSFLFTAIERNTKLLIAWQLGKRDQFNTDIFCKKLARSTGGRFHLSSDGFGPYRDSVPRTFGSRVDFGMVIKTYGKTSQDDQRQYSPARIISMKKEAVHNWPRMDRTCTSHVERMNLNLRTFIRRMTRLSNGFSKKWANHEAMLGLFIAHYNFCRTHGTLKTTPAVASGLTGRKWTVRDLIEKTSTH